MTQPRDVGPHCPTSAALLDAIHERIAKWQQRGDSPKDILNLSGVLQFGLVSQSVEQQLAEARDYWSGYVGDCSCCGCACYEVENKRQPACGHLYCGICWGRGHDEECIQGLCSEDESQ